MPGTYISSPGPYSWLLLTTLQPCRLVSLPGTCSSTSGLCSTDCVLACPIMGFLGPAPSPSCSTLNVWSCVYPVISAASRCLLVTILGNATLFSKDHTSLQGLRLNTMAPLDSAPQSGHHQTNYSQKDPPSCLEILLYVWSWTSASLLCLLYWIK